MAASRDAPSVIRWAIAALSASLSEGLSAPCGRSDASASILPERGVNKLTVPVLLEYCPAVHKTPNEILGFDQDERLNSELLSILDTFDKEQYERAIRVLKAL